jgi:urea carboxylase
VSPEELLAMRADQAAGRLPLRITEGEFSMAEYEQFLAANDESIADFRERQSAAFESERQAWVASGEFERAAQATSTEAQTADLIVPDGCEAVEAQFAANVFRIDVAGGDTVSAGQTLLAVEAMKMEASVTAPFDGVVVEVLTKPGAEVRPGTALVILRPSVEEAAA